MLGLALLAVAALRPELAVFEPLVGHCWVGQSPDGSRDTHCFESVYDGKLVRDRHEVPGNPPYRGETTYSWTSKNARIDYTYWNSFGDAYRGEANAVPGGIEFTDHSLATPVTIMWRFVGDGAYEVVRGANPPVRFTRKD